MDATYIDNDSGLEWLIYPDSGNFNWDRIHNYPSGELEDSSWRIPTWPEVMTLLVFTEVISLKEPELFGGLIIWVNHGSVFNEQDAYTASFFDGRLYPSNKKNPRVPVFVRNIQ